MQIKKTLFLKFIFTILILAVSFFSIESIASYINFSNIENNLLRSFENESSKLKSIYSVRKEAALSLKSAYVDNKDFDYWNQKYIDLNYFDSVSIVNYESKLDYFTEINDCMEMYTCIDTNKYLKFEVNSFLTDLENGEIVISDSNGNSLNPSIDIDDLKIKKQSPTIFGIEYDFFEHLYTFEDSFFLYQNTDDMNFTIYYIIEKNIANKIADDNFEKMKFIIYIALGLIMGVIIFNWYRSVKRDLFISRLTTNDKLTRAWNLDKFKEVLDKKLLKKKSRYTIYSFDICKFRFINETRGRDFGDTMLINIVRSIQIKSNRKTLLARGNNDVFYLAKQDVDSKRRIDVFQNIVDDLNAIYSAEGLTVFLDCGCVTSDKDLDANQVIDACDITRKLIKKNDLVHFAVYSPSIMKEMKRKNELAEWAPNALKNEEFEAYFQPKAQILDNDIVYHGAEALVRWKRDGEIISPGDFIPLFEENGFIVEFDFYMFEQVCKHLKLWIDKKIDFDVVSINFSRRHLTNTDFVKKLNEIRSKYKIPANKIEIEILEGSFVDGYDDFSRICYKLRQSGYRIAIDDFGSGYSSLNALKNIDADVIKVDKGFFLEDKKIRKKDVSNKDSKILKGIVQMISDLNLDVVFEGVENDEILSKLRDMLVSYLKINKKKDPNDANVYLIQGYHYSKPIQAVDFEKFIVDSKTSELTRGKNGKDKRKENIRGEENKV